MVFMTILLFIIGFLSIPTNNTSAVRAMASLMNIWTFTYQMTVGPICFVVISGISATRLEEQDHCDRDRRPGGIHDRHHRLDPLLC